MPWTPSLHLGPRNAACNTWCLKSQLHQRPKLLGTVTLVAAELMTAACGSTDSSSESAAVSSSSSSSDGASSSTTVGPDTGLFLVVLTIAVVGARVTRTTTWRVVKLVTAFTVGHATSLCLAYFNVVSIPASLVEPAIALSIVAAAAVAIVRKGDGIRPWLAAAIGLIHGLGFASSLRGLGVASAHEIPALAAFNIGIDVAQTAVVLLVTAALWLATRLPARANRWLLVAVCAAIGLVGMMWTVDRVFL